MFSFWLVLKIISEHQGNKKLNFMRIRIKFHTKWENYDIIRS